MGRCEARRDTECGACSVLLCIEMYLLLLCPLAKGGEGTLGDEGRGPGTRCCSLPRWGGAGRLRQGHRALLPREAGWARGPWPDAGKGWAAGGRGRRGENAPY